MKGYFYRLIPPRPTFSSDMSPEEGAVMGAHFKYWSTLMKEGKVLAFGPVGAPTGGYGFAILTVENGDEAAALRDNDPAVLSPHGFKTDLDPIMALVTASGTLIAT